MPATCSCGEGGSGGARSVGGGCCAGRWDLVVVPQNAAASSRLHCDSTAVPKGVRGRPRAAAAIASCAQAGREFRGRPRGAPSALRTLCAASTDDRRAPQGSAGTVLGRAQLYPQAPGRLVGLKCCRCSGNDGAPLKSQHENPSEEGPGRAEAGRRGAHAVPVASSTVLRIVLQGAGQSIHCTLSSHH